MSHFQNGEKLKLKIHHHMISTLQLFFMRFSILTFLFFQHVSPCLFVPLLGVIKSPHVQYCQCRLGAKRQSLRLPPTSLVLTLTLLNVLLYVF